jgi:hypothetical protein
MNVLDKKPELCWDLADREIARYRREIALAEKGFSSSNVDVCHAQIDKWLEYRFEHGPEEVVSL